VELETQQPQALANLIKKMFLILIALAEALRMIDYFS
jgi:hypothetical protein